MAYTGLYNADGQRQVVIVSGTVYTGLYNPDGSYNGVLSNGSVYVGAMHPCGAYNVTIDTNPTPSMGHYAPDGSQYIYTNNTTGGYVLPGGNGNYSTIPSFVPAAIASAGFDVYANLKTNQAWVKQGNVSTTASAILQTTRVSTSTQTDSQGNIVTIPSTNLCLSDLGLGVWEGTTNLCLNSNTSGGANWVSSSFTGNGGTVTANTTDVLDPMGGNTATKLTVVNSGTPGYFATAIPVTSSTQYTFSVYLRLGTLAASDYGFALYDETNAAFLPGFSNTTVTFSPAPNGWTRASATFTTTATQTALRAYTFRQASINPGTVYTWGAQVEQKTYATAYYPSGTSAGVRNGDAPLLNLAAVGSPIISNSALSIYGKGTSLISVPIGTGAGLLSVDDATTNNRMYLRKNVSSLGETTLIVATVVGYQQLDNVNWPINTSRKMALAAVAGNIRGASNGVLLTAGGTTMFSGVTLRLAIGTYGNVSQFNGNIEEFAIAFNSRVTDANLQTITT